MLKDLVAELYREPDESSPSPSYPTYLKLILILFSYLGLSTLSGFLIKILCISRVPHACYTPHPSHSPRLINIILVKISNYEVLSVQIFPASRYFFFPLYRFIL